MDPLSGRVIKNSVVCPTIRVASHPDKLLMGVFDEHDAYVEGTVLDRRSGEQGAPVPPGLFGCATDSDTPEAIYAGPLYFHFGHFLLESLARAWYAHRFPEAPLVWAGQHNWQGYELRPWQLEILEILSITNVPQIVADPTRFELLHVPQIGYRYDDTFHPQHAEFLGRYRGPSQVAGHRLWLSRSGIESDVRDLNSGPTERRLSAAGWTIVHPEALSIREQLDHLSRAEVVAGEEGSAFHALLLLRDVRAKTFHVLRRHGREHRNMHTIGDARQVNQSFYSVQRQLVLRAEGRAVSKINPSSAEILGILQVPVPPPQDVAMGKADAALERVLATLQPQCLLEVGAESPRLVATSTARCRVAVSRHFGFDLRTYAASGVEFYELSLDEYAELFHKGHHRFDVIRLTAVDLAEVMSSFRASIPLVSDGAIWVLGHGELAARAALSIHTAQPAFHVSRLLVGGSLVYLAQSVLGEPTSEADVAELSSREVSRRLRWTRPVSLRHLRRHRLERQALLATPPEVGPAGSS